MDPATLQLQAALSYCQTIDPSRRDLVRDALLSSLSATVEDSETIPPQPPEPDQFPDLLMVARILERTLRDPGFVDIATGRGDDVWLPRHPEERLVRLAVGLPILHSDAAVAYCKIIQNAVLQRLVLRGLVVAIDYLSSNATSPDRPAFDMLAYAQMLQRAFHKTPFWGHVLAGNPIEPWNDVDVHSPDTDLRNTPQASSAEPNFAGSLLSALDSSGVGPTSDPQISVRHFAGHRRFWASAPTTEMTPPGLYQRPQRGERRAISIDAVGALSDAISIVLAVNHVEGTLLLKQIRKICHAVMAGIAASPDVSRIGDVYLPLRREPVFHVIHFDVASKDVQTRSIIVRAELPEFPLNADVASTSPILVPCAALPLWTAAEREARRMCREIPSSHFTAARRLLVRPPHEVTPEYVCKLARRAVP